MQLDSRSSRNPRCNVSVHQQGSRKQHTTRQSLFWLYVLLCSCISWLRCLMGGRVSRWPCWWLGGWMGVVSYVGECCCCRWCYLEVSACHCCVIADPHHTRQQREAVWRQFTNRDTPNVYLCREWRSTSKYRVLFPFGLGEERVGVVDCGPLMWVYCRVLVISGYRENTAAERARACPKRPEIRF